MKLIFNGQQLAPLAAHALAAKENYIPYVTNNDASAGLILVGDRGVYLMSNGKPAMPQGENAVYATGCNPDVDDFETWWANKNASFGGDDGAELLVDEHDILTRIANGECERLEVECGDTFGITAVWRATERTEEERDAHLAKKIRNNIIFIDGDGRIMKIPHKRGFTRGELNDNMREKYPDAVMLDDLPIADAVELLKLHLD